jgi:hypothetical protein
MTKERPSTIYEISRQPRVMEKMQQLSVAEQGYPTESAHHATMLAMMLQLV